MLLTKIYSNAKLISIWAVASLFGCEEYQVQIEHGFERTYTTTIIRAVGPTTLTGARGTLPQPSPSDANAIWLAPNGSDANPGTEASPKLTLSAAIGALTGPKPTVHIFRNSFVGSISFTETSAQTLPASRNIQVEEGETATINLNVAGIFIDGLILSGTNLLNGLTIIGTNTTAGGIFPIRSGGGSNTISNCQIEDNQNLSGNASAQGIISTGAGDVIEYSLLSNLEANSPAANTNNNATVTNCFFFPTLSSVEQGNNSLFGLLVNNVATPSAAQTITIERTYFVGDYASAIRFLAVAVTSASNALTLDIDACVFLDNQFAITGLANPGSDWFSNININTSSNKTADPFFTGITAVATDTPDITDYTITITDEITDFPLMLIDEKTGIDNSDGDLLRLQFKGKVASNGAEYFIDSPLIERYLIPAPDEDINPWDESTVLTSIAFNNTTNLDNSAFAISFDPEFKNPIEKDDVNGNLHNDYDSIRNRIQLDFGDEYGTTNEEIWNLMYMASDKGSKRFYPLDIGVTIFDDETSGVFSDADNSFALTLSVNMITNHWRGWWIIILDGSVYKHYYIQSNDTTKLYLTNKIEAAFPANGTYDFSIEYILVKSPLETIIASQKRFTIFSKGGRWRERTPDNQENYQYTTDKVVFVEVEDLKEA